MRNSVACTFKKSRAGRFLCAIFLPCAILAAAASGQSQRHKMAGTVGKVAPSPSMRLYAATRPEIDIDTFFGKIIRREGDIAYVYVTTSSRISGRVPLYYACDVKMRPTAILTPAGISHKACAVFKVGEGSAIVGDTVMVKYFARNAEENKQSE